MEHYSKDFREQALKLSDEIGLKKAVEQLGIKYGTLSDWRKKRNMKKSDSPISETEPLTERERKLLKENLELKEANEILKDALGFFAKDRRK
jgi:transposase